MKTDTLEAYARAFDTPPTSDEHRRWFECVWVAGKWVAVRYYLGRLIGRNLFREADADVSAALVAFVAEITSPEGASLIGGEGLQGWLLAEPLLRHLFETSNIGGFPGRRHREAAAIRAFLSDPDIQPARLAILAGTTEKQLARMPSVAQLRRLAQRQPRSGGRM